MVIRTFVSKINMKYQERFQFFSHKYFKIYAKIINVQQFSTSFEVLHIEFDTRSHFFLVSILTNNIDTFIDIKKEY